MEYVNLGRTGLKVSRLSFGTANFNRVRDDDACIEVLEAALEAGINFFDTANMYDEGRSEQITGRAFQGRRHDVVIASKVGMRLGEGPNRIGLNRKTIMEEIEGSLKRLQTDHVDVYYAHQLDVTTPIDETMRAFDDLVRQGKVRYLGCSNFPAWRLCKALWTSDASGLARFDCVQPRYNMLERGIERELVPLCIDQGVGMNPYAPLAGGLLSGKYRWGEEPGENTRYHGVTQYRDWYWTEANFQAIEGLRAVAEDNGHGLAEVALAWMLQKPGMTSPIFSARTVEQLELNLASMDVTLSENEIAACEALSPPAP